MENKIFIAPKLNGSRFEDHSLPLNVLEDFNALQSLFIEIAKVIYLEENRRRKRVPKGFSEGFYLKLVEIEEGSAIAKFVAAASIVANSIQFESSNDLNYFEKAKEKFVQLVESFNCGEELGQEDVQFLPYFNKIGKNLVDDESIDFGYDHKSKTSSKAILNKEIRNKILNTLDQKSEYQKDIELFALVPEIDQKNNTFQIETDLGNFKCKIEEYIKPAVFSVFSNYQKGAYILLNCKAVFGLDNKIKEVLHIDSVEVLNPLDVQLRISNLLKLKDKWFEGQGKAINKNNLEHFGSLFKEYYKPNLTLPAIFPKIDGNIQLEWKNESKNIIVEVELETLLAEFLYFDGANENDDTEMGLNLNIIKGWEELNRLIEFYL